MQLLAETGNIEVSFTCTYWFCAAVTLLLLLLQFARSVEGDIRVMLNGSSGEAYRSVKRYNRSAIVIINVWKRLFLSVQCNA